MLFVLILCVWVSILRNSEAEGLAKELTERINPNAADIQELATQVAALNRLVERHHQELVELVKANKSQARVGGELPEPDNVALGDKNQEQIEESFPKRSEPRISPSYDNTMVNDTPLDASLLDTFQEDVAAYRQVMSKETRHMITDLKRRAIETIIRDSEVGRHLTNQQIQEIVDEAEQDPALREITTTLDDAIVGQMMIDEVYKGIKPEPGSFSFTPAEPTP